MSRYMVRICADGQIGRIPCKGLLKLEKLQELVGGYIETVPVRMKPEEGVRPLLIVDEEGRLKGKPLNEPATILSGAVADILGSAVIVGDAVLVGAMGAELIGLSKSEAARITQILEGISAVRKAEERP